MQYVIGTPAKSSSAEVVVSVVDINDHSPVLAGRKYTTVRVTTSDFTSGKAVYRAEATDTDSGDNGAVRYSLARIRVDPHAFTVDEESGVVTPHGIPVSRFYTMKVIAKDRGQPPRSTYMYLFVKVCRYPDGGWFCVL